MSNHSGPNVGESSQLSDAKSHSDSDVPNGPTIMVVAGEESSDLHAAELCRSIRKLNPKAEFFGMGGSHCRDAGVKTTVDSEEVAGVMGLVEVLGHARPLLGALKRLRDTAKERQPDLIVFVDFPDFNFALGRMLKGLKSKKLYYISPQVWAWRQGRVKLIKRLIDKVIPIFPFEIDFYKKHSVDAQFVGHPFLDPWESPSSKEEFFAELDLNPDQLTLAILPGSRKAEIEKLLRPMLEGFSLILEKHPNTQAILPVAENIELSEVEKTLASVGLDKSKNIELIKSRAREVLTHADAGLIASGTATVEATVSGCPIVIVYKMADFTYQIAQRLVKGVKFAGMPNILLDREAFPELLQEKVTPGNIALHLEELIWNKERFEKARKDVKLVSEKLRYNDKTNNDSPSSSGSSSDRAAEIALDLISDGVASKTMSKETSPASTDAPKLANQ